MTPPPLRELYGRLDEETHEAVTTRAAANAYGEAITPFLERAIGSPAIA